MTQPDQFFPATAVNATPGFAAYANTTQTDYENQINNSVGLSPFSGLCGLFSQLPFLDGTSVFGQTHGGDPLGGITTNLMHGIQSLANIFCHILTGASGDASPATLIDGFAGLLEAVLDNPLTNGFIELATDAGNVIANLLGGIGDFANQLCSVFNTGTPANKDDPANSTSPGGILGALTTITNIFLNNPFMSTLSDLVTGTGSVFFDIINGFVSFFNGILGIFGNFIGATGILSGFQGIIDSFFGIFGGSGTGNTVEGLTGIAGGFFTGIANLAAGIITTIIDTIAGFFGFHPSDSGSGSQGGLGGLGDIIGSLVGSVTGVVSGLFGLGDGTANAAGGFNNNGDGTALFDIVTAPVNALINIGEGIAMTVASFIGNLTGSLGGLGSSSDGHASNSGTLGGLISGIIGAPATLVSGVTHTISDLIHHFLNFPGDNIASNVNTQYTGAYDINQAILHAIWGPDGPPPSNWMEQSRIQAEASYQQAQAAAKAQGTAIALAHIQASLAAAIAHETSNNGYGGAFWNFGVTGADGAILPSVDFASTGPTSGDLVVRQSARGKSSDKQIDSSSGVAVGIKAANSDGTYWTVVNHTYTADGQNLAVSLTGDSFAGIAPGAALYLFMHCDTALSTGAYCKILTTGLQVGKFVRNGAQFMFTPFADPNSTLALNIGLNSAVEFRNVGTNWTVSVNANPVLDADDSTVTFSTASRTAGLAMQRISLVDDGALGTGQFDGFQVKAISMADVVTPTYPGSGAVISQRNGIIVTLTGGSAFYPLTFFDTIDNTSADLDPDLSTGSFTVSQAGWYKIDVFSNAAGNSGDLLFLAIKKNGVLHRYGNVMQGPFGPTMQASWTVPLHANDVIQLGYIANNPSGLAYLGGGDVNGLGVWASITQTSNTLQQA